jgi:outer membrane protein assembly factor BamB
MYQRTKKNLITIALLSISITGCSKLDDYMLGKDNTPAPKTLEPVNSKAPLTEKWSAPTGFNKKNSAYLKLKPVIKGNTVYVADASGVVQAVDTSNGRAIWSQKLNSGVISGPTVANGYVVVGTDASKIVTLKQDTGAEIWQADLTGDVLAKPVITQNKVIAKTIDGNLYAFDLNKGNRLWISEHGAPSLILKASSSPVIVDNKMALVGYSDGKMDAVDLQTGQVLWQRSIAFASGSSDVERLVDIDADPIVQGNTVLLASYQGYIGALALSDGQFAWRKPASTYKNIIVRGAAVYMTDSNDIVWSIDKQTGHVNWKQDKLKSRGLTEPSLLAGNIVVGDKTGMLHILSAKNGEFISRAQLGGAITISPGVSGNSVYVLTANGKLSRFSVS